MTNVYTIPKISAKEKPPNRYSHKLDSQIIILYKDLHKVSYYIYNDDDDHHHYHQNRFNIYVIYEMVPLHWMLETTSSEIKHLTLFHIKKTFSFKILGQFLKYAVTLSVLAYSIGYFQNILRSSKYGPKIYEINVMNVTNSCHKQM